MKSSARLTVLALVICICSSIATIALGFEVHGLIAQKWQSLGGVGGFLHAPLTNETTTPDGVGRFNHFQGGSIYWTPNTGAHEVHGQIRNKWESLGWERSYLGYPISDELDMGDGRGRFSNFQGGTIFWSEKSGAHEMHGQILNKWKGFDRERRSYLGYPISDEFQDGAFRRSNFERGMIRWSAETGAVASRGGHNID